MMIDFALIWAGIIVFAVLIYVVLDGFDLGVGILFPVARCEEDRDMIMNSVAPVWDGNETWLVLGGGGLLAAFPLAYAVILPALYMPITAMLLALVFRGVAFEYRWRTQRWKRVWDVAFTGGSLVAAMMQGITLGAIVQGIRVVDRAYAGGWWDWLSAFSLLVGISVVLGYMLLGSTWLVLKTTGALQTTMRGVAWKAGIATLVCILMVSAFTPMLNPAYAERWFSWPGIMLSLLIPLLVIAASWTLFTGLNDHRDVSPFLSALALFVLCFIGIGISFYPYLVPPTLSLYAAAAPVASLKFALIGVVVLLPLILLYTGYAYWVFRGKMNPLEGYH